MNLKLICWFSPKNLKALSFEETLAIQTRMSKKKAITLIVLMVNDYMRLRD